MSQEKVLLEKKENVYYLTLNSPKTNPLNPELIKLIHDKLDLIEKDDDTIALVVTSSFEKFFSTGLDLKFLMTLKNNEEFNDLLIKICQLIGRLLIFPCPTIAMIQGYCMAGGYALATALDYRFCAQENTVIQMNEAEMGVGLPPGIYACLKARLSPQTFRNCAIFAQKYNGPDAKKFGLVDQCFPQQNLKEETHKFANEIADKSKFKEGFRSLKKQVYAEYYELCMTEEIHATELKMIQAVGSKL